MEGTCGGDSPICCIIVLSLALQFCVCHKEVIDLVPLVGKGPLSAVAKRPVCFPIKAPLLGPDRFFRTLNNSNDFAENQSRVCIIVRRVKGKIECPDLKTE